MSALISAVLVAFLAGTVADAQVLYGSIVGNVTDSTGAAVPGATVTIEQAETKLTRELVTDAAGAYHFTAVPSGTYSVTVTMTGFRIVQPPGCPGHAQLGGARRREAGASGSWRKP